MAHDHEPDLNHTEQAFLDAAHTAERPELTAAHRRAQRLRALAGGLAVLVIVAAVSAVLAARETRRAALERSTAVSRSLAQQALARLGDDFVLAALLGLEAYRTHPTLEARSATLGGLAEVLPAGRVLARHTDAVNRLAFNPPTARSPPPPATRR